ncbi:MAG: CynX/NimT family MFS transporter [Solimonas sp.]
MQRKWWVMAAVSLVFAFDTGATFSSLGIVLFAMARDFGWSHAAAGLSFSLLGLACGLASPVPAWLMRRIGSRLTVVLGAAMLGAGCLLAYCAHGLWLFYLAMILLGAGFTLSGNVPGIYLLAAWFPQRSARMIGLYLMCGAVGGMVAPPLAQALVAWSGGWRAHWLALAAIAAAVAAFCYAAIRNPQIETQAARGPRATEDAETGWTLRAALRSPAFGLITAAYVLITACATTMHSATVAHLDQLGQGRLFAAFLLGLVGFASAFAKGFGGWLGERIGSRRLLMMALAGAALGMFLLGIAGNAPSGYLFALCFGLGWGGTYLATHVLLIEWFGRGISAGLLAALHLWSTVATAGPLLAGVVADRAGSFAPVFWLYAVLLLAVAILLAAPRLRGTAPAQPA